MRTETAMRVADELHMLGPAQRPRLHRQSSAEASPTAAKGLAVLDPDHPEIEAPRIGELQLRLEERKLVRKGGGIGNIALPVHFHFHFHLFHTHEPLHHQTRRLGSSGDIRGRLVRSAADQVAASTVAVVIAHNQSCAVVDTAAIVLDSRRVVVGGARVGATGWSSGAAES